MKIDYQSNSNEESHDTTPKEYGRNVTDFIEELEKKYGKINAYNLDGEIFFYRPLKRGEYLKLCKIEKLSELDKEDIVCSSCIVYPENYDFENCDAAVPTILCKAIMKSSYLDSIETRAGLISYFRGEMFDFQNQITCIINEAFPQFSLEEIEDWDMEKTAMYLSRAEWKLVNLRGANINFDPVTQQPPVPEENNTPKTENKKSADENFKGGKKEKMTPEKLRELQVRYPEIDWAADAVANEGIDGLKNAGAFDTVSPALRPGY